MNRIFLVLILFVIAFITPISSLAQFQPAPVEKSKQKMLYEGKVYFIHTVKSNQTLSSISRAYGVTIQDIAVANPNIILEVISVGQVLRIPNISALSEFSESYFNLSENDFLYHTVQPQQTIHYLSKKYNVSKEDIYYYNPGSDELIQIGQVIKIPKKHVLESSNRTTSAADSNVYIVKKGDTLYSLSKKYGVSIAELIRINPDLRWGLKEGMALSLLGSSENKAFNHNVGILTEQSIPKIDLYKATKCDSINQLNLDRTIKIALVLPFHANELLLLDTITNDSILHNHPYYKYRSRGYSFADFYEGFMLAIDSIKKTGVDITLFTFDTKSDSIETDKIANELEIIRPNLIYGPIIPKNIARISAYSEKNEIPLILPLTKDKDRYTNNNPYAISLIPNFESEKNNCADYVSQFSEKNIILIHSDIANGESRVDDFRETLFAYFSSKAAYENALYKEIRINDTLPQNIKHALRDNMENIVLVLSANEANVSNIIGQLRINQSLGYSINVFGLPTWQSFDNLRIELLHMLNTVIYSPFYVDYSKPHTKAFVSNCRAVLGYEPYKTVSTGSGFNFTFLGYEAGFMFSQAYKKYGSEFLNCLCHLEFDMPQSHYRFEWNSNGGFSNSNMNFINYNTNFEVKAIEFNSLKELNNQEHEPEVDLSQFFNQKHK